MAFLASTPLSQTCRRCLSLQSALFLIALVLLVFLSCLAPTQAFLPSFHQNSKFPGSTPTEPRLKRALLPSAPLAFSAFSSSSLPLPLPSSSSSTRRLAYLRPEDSSPATSSASTTTTDTTAKKLFTPQVGDLVRYYDLDGGDSKGQELVGKITFLTKVGSTGNFLAELRQLEDLGDGYFDEFSFQKRIQKRTERDIRDVSPLTSSFVRSEQAYKVPYDTAAQRVKVRQEQYDLEGWTGPQIQYDIDVVKADGILYSQIKFDLLKNTAIAGLLGTVVARISQGQDELAAIYFAGSLASLLYLFFLSIKTDSLAKTDNKMGDKLSNVRFAMPALVLAGVVVYNQSLGEANPMLVPSQQNVFSQVTKEQFAAAVIGFLTYRIPLFLGQLQQFLKSEENGNMVLPGSAGVAVKLAQAAKKESSLQTDGLIPVLVVSGPQATGRDELVQQLLEEDDRLISPQWVDRISDGATFDRLEGRDEFLFVRKERYGLTKQGILEAAAAYADDAENRRVVVVNADVSLAQKLSTSLSGAKLIGVWVGLDSVQEFERRITAQMDSGELVIPLDETRESMLRARIKEIIKEIDFGLSSGIFEFTILNSDPTKSLKELKDAADYCFL